MNDLTQAEILPNVLVVDDNPNNIFAMRSLLENMPIKLYEARSGNEALIILMQHEFALILLDVQMPDMDGFELAGLMRMNKRTKDIPIIFVTAINKEEQYIKRGLLIGAVDYLFKPIDPVILESKVSVFINYFIQQKKMERLVSELSESQGILTKKNETLNHLAHTDIITGLDNRLNFEESLEGIVKYSKEFNKEFAILMLDLDNFKYANDTFGHDCGDLILREVAYRIKNCIRTNDLICRPGIGWSAFRLGGDEFAIMLTGINDLAIAGKIAKKIIDVLAEPFYFEESKIYISASIGISSFPITGDTSEVLMKNADIAMYRAKHSGKNQYQYFSEDMQKQYYYQAKLESAIKLALEKNEFYLVYQPILNLVSLDIVGVEILCRWHNPELGDIRPDIFIPVAEETDIIRDLGQWVVSTSMKDMQHFYEIFHLPINYYVNVSPKQLIDDKFVVYVKAMLEANAFPPGKVTLELTETALMENLQTLEAQINTLSQLGFTICADDFGKGYSSLNRLISLPISSLKIDKTFMQALSEHPEDTTVIKSILGLAANLNLTTIAEGIETKEQLEFLIKHNCRFGQGYYFSKPKRIEELEYFMQHHQMKTGKIPQS